MDYKNKNLSEFTLREVYSNYREFEKEFPSIINTINYRSILGGAHNPEGPFYAKLKFAKALEEYRKSLYIMPYTWQLSNDDISRMLDKIVDSFENIKVRDIKEPVKYDMQSKDVIFDRERYETEIFDELMVKFTEISLKDRFNTVGKDLEGNEIKCSMLDKGRIDYLSRKAVAARWTIRDGESYTCMQDVKGRTIEGKTFDKLVYIFGEEKMLGVNSSNFQELAKDFEKYGVSAKNFFEDLERVGNTNLSDNEIEKCRIRIENNCRTMTIKMNTEKENQRTPSKKIYGQIRGFEKILNLCDDIPEDKKNKMLDNIFKNAKEFEYKVIGQEKNTAAALYYSMDRKIVLGKDPKVDANAKYKNIIHELIHAATTERDEFGNDKRIGIEQKENSEIVGRGLNEGITEYFAQKFYSKLGRPKVYVGYPNEVKVIKELVGLYGEDILLEGMLEGPQNLEKLMAKDGKNYTELRDLMDEYFVTRNKEEYNKAAEKYVKIQDFIGEIKAARQVDIQKENQVEYRDKKENKIVTWFKNIKNKVKGIFNKQEQLLLLNPGVPAVEKTDKKGQAFIESIKVDSKDLNTNNSHNINENVKTYDKEEER